MSALTVAVILLIPLVTLWWESAKLTPLVVTSVSLTPVLLGYAELDALNGTSTALMYCAAVGFLVAGHLVHQSWRRLRRHTAPPPSADNRPRRSTPGVIGFSCIVVILTFYHFLISGVPLFSEDVETARFDFTSSGLFGIPGRMFLFGLPFTVLLVSVAAVRRIAPVSRTLVYFVWGSYAITCLLGGFKGGLVVVLTTMLLARSIVGRPLSLRRAVMGWRVLVIVGALVYCGLISFRYRSLGLTSPGDVIPYLATRATTSAAAPGYLVFSRYGTDGAGGDHYAQDAAYFFRKYLPFIFPDDGVTLPFDKTVSAALYHTPISSTSFIVPVTVGAFPELVSNVGVGAAMTGMFLIGVCISYFVSRAQLSSGAFQSALFALTVNLLQIYILNGNLVYTCFNLVLVGLFLFGLYWVCHIPWALSLDPSTPRFRRAGSRGPSAVGAANAGLVVLDD
jgi:hypothetical protein